MTPDFADVLVLRDQFAANKKSEGQVADLLQVRVGLVRPPGYRRVKGPQLTARVVAHICRHLADYDQEHLVTLCVHEDGTLMAIHEASIGTSNQAHSTAQIMLKVALLVGASSIYVVHNHPSGDPTLSQEDRDFTGKLELAANCVGLGIEDSVVVAFDGWNSYGNAYETGRQFDWEDEVEQW